MLIDGELISSFLGSVARFLYWSFSDGAVRGGVDEVFGGARTSSTGP